MRARAWRCQQRLYHRWRRIAARGKPRQKIVVACAHKLAGFVWAIATEQPLGGGLSAKACGSSSGLHPTTRRNPRRSYAAPAIAGDPRR